MPISESEDGPGLVQRLLPFKPGSDAGMKRLNYATHTAPARPSMSACRHDVPALFAGSSERAGGAESVPSRGTCLPGSQPWSPRC
jgi:hypothetical protein